MLRTRFRPCYSNSIARVAQILVLLLALTSITGAQSDGVVYVYDELGRLIAVIDLAGETAVYSYDAVGNLLSISRHNSSVLSVIEFTPKTGPIATTVKIFGTAFNPNPSENVVNFNGVTATVTSASTTQIVATVPAGATTGPISVTTAAGTASSSTSFVVGESGVPTITSFSPTIGMAGTAVTIEGTNFQPNLHDNKTKFNTTYADITSATTTTIATKVPSLAGSGRIGVATYAGSAVSTDDFFIPPSPYTVADVAVTGRMAIGTDKVVTIPTANKMGIIVFDGSAGQWVSLGMSNTTIGAPGCCTTSTVAIYKPNGTILLAPFGFYQVGGGTPSIQLPVTGTYSIVVDPYSTVVGSVTLSLSEDLSPPISINGPAVPLTSRPGQNARLFFSGNAGQWVSVGISNTTVGAPSCCTTSTVSILKSDGTALLAPYQFYQAGAGTPSVQLPSTGTYAIFVDPYNAVAGNFTVTLSEDLSPPISINGPAVPLTNRAGQNARLSFTGNAGQWVSLGVSDTTIGAPSCCTTSTVAIYKPDGTALLTPLQFYQPIGTNSLQLPATGTYTILVDPYLAVAGNATLTLSEDLSQSIIINGPQVTLMNRAGQNERVSFSGNAGQWISLAVTDVTIAAPTCCTFTTLAIYKPDGTTLLAPITIPAAGITTQSIQLTATGTYTIFVDPYNAVAGNATITLSEDLSPPISIDGPPVVLTFNRVGQNSRLLFSGNAGQWVSVGTIDSTISATGCCSSSTVALYKPDGTQLLAPFVFYSFGGGTPSVQLPVTGTYAMVVEPFNGMLGSVTLLLNQDLSPPISINGPAVTLTSRAGQNARLFFSGSAGQWVSVGISNTTVAASSCCTTSTVSILKPDGTTLLAPYQFYQSGAGSPSVQLPSSGTYAVFVDPYNAVAGNITVTLSEDLSPPISINGPAVTLTNRVGQNARLFFSGNAGQWISVGISDTTVGAPSCCTTSTVAILKPDGTALLTPYQFYQAGAGTPSVQLPSSGTYAIVVDPYLAVAGNFTVTLSEDLSPPISINGPAVPMTNRAGQNARLFFSGNAGQWIGVGVGDTTIGAPSCCTTSTVSILKPDGTALLTPLQFYQGGTGTPSLQLPTTGTYAILVDPYLAVAGNFTVTLSEDLTPPISINGSAVPLTNRAGQNARLSFTGNAGQWVSLGVSDTTIGAPSCCTTSTVAIYKPDGTALLSPLQFYQPLGTNSLQLPTTGTYTIVLDPYLAVAGNTTLTLSEDLSPPITVSGPPVVLQLNRVGQNGRLSFSGTAGQQITVRITDNTAGSTIVTLLKPDGTTLTSSNSSNSSFNLAAQVLPVTGTFVVKVDPNGINVGNLSVSLYDPVITNASNLAYNKTTTQSSTAYSAPASRAVDGNTSGNWNDGSVTHTSVQSQAWWEVDLGSVESIATIDVWNRTDCCGSALTNFYVFVSDVPFTSTDLTTTINQSGVSSTNVTGQAGTPTSLTVNRTGRYVRVQLVSTSERLSLAEVQVWRP